MDASLCPTARLEPSPDSPHSSYNRKSTRLRGGTHGFRSVRKRAHVTATRFQNVSSPQKNPVAAPALTVPPLPSA